MAGKEGIETLYTNRELSWIQFNERVLEESEDQRVPLYERLKFVAIFQSNLDEFFMVRVGSLYDQTLLKEKVLDSKTQMTATEQLQAIYKQVRSLLPRKVKAYSKLIEKLSAQGLEQVSFKNLSDQDFAYLKVYFEKEIMPLTSPQIVDKRQPFPFLKNKGIYVGVRSRDRVQKLSCPAGDHLCGGTLLAGCFPSGKRRKDPVCPGGGFDLLFCRENF